MKNVTALTKGLANASLVSDSPTPARVISCRQRLSSQGCSGVCTLISSSSLPLALHRSPHRIARSPASSRPTRRCETPARRWWPCRARSSQRRLLAAILIMDQRGPPGEVTRPRRPAGPQVTVVRFRLPCSVRSPQPGSVIAAFGWWLDSEGACRFVRGYSCVALGMCQQSETEHPLRKWLGARFVGERRRGMQRQCVEARQGRACVQGRCVAALESCKAGTVAWHGMFASAAPTYNQTAPLRNERAPRCAQPASACKIHATRARRSCTCLRTCCSGGQIRCARVIPCRRSPGISANKKPRHCGRGAGLLWALTSSCRRSAGGFPTRARPSTSRAWRG